MTFGGTAARNAFITALAATGLNLQTPMDGPVFEPPPMIGITVGLATDRPPRPVPSWPTWLTLPSFAAVYSAIAAVMTSPLVLNLSSRLPRDLGDPLLVSSLLWWNANVAPLTDRWWDGPGFFPAHGMLAFSEHFLGASLLASPLQWAGLDAITAYNLATLASFPLCAITAHGLALTLTRRHDASFICGLAFGFNPLRVAQVEHLELLAAFGMPVALAALHRYLDTRGRWWLAVFAAALMLQALSASYYAVFFTVFFGLWVLWFMRLQDWRHLLAIGASGALAMLAVWPIVAGYSEVHASYNWRRDLVEETLRFSADLASFVTASPLSAVWGWTAAAGGMERQLFPGLTMPVVAIGGLIWAVRAGTIGRDEGHRVPRVLWALSAVFLIVAATAMLIGPWQVGSGWMRVSVSTPYKPFSVGVALAIMGVMATARFRAAFRGRSALAFYLLAAAFLFACALGPQPTLLGERVLYQPPYAWLARLPFFGDTIRVPARFAMLGILALAVAASLAFHRLARPGPRRWVLVAVVAGILLDGWIQALPMASVPRQVFAIPAGEPPAAVLELPLGNVWRDTAAIYRATYHGVRVVNGYNGFEPIYYQVLRRGLDDLDPTVLDGLASFGPILVALDRAADSTGRMASWLEAHAGVTRLHNDGPWTMYWLARDRRGPRRRCAGPWLEVAGAVNGDGAADTDTAALTDRIPATRMIGSAAPGTDDEIVLDLGWVRHPCSIHVALGVEAIYYPGAVEVDTSTDAVSWEPVLTQRMAGPTLLATLTDPRDTRVALPLPGRAARFIRLRVDHATQREAWAIADLIVR